jgi:hypothetical protein
VLSLIGLAFDLVGAVTLAVGLFRPPRRALLTYLPEEAARDTSFGAVGASLLGVGFAMQSLAYFGVHVCSPLWARIVVSLAALAVGAMYAVAVFDLLFPLVYRFQCGRVEVNSEWEAIVYTPPLKREPKGLRL